MRDDRYMGGGPELKPNLRNESTNQELFEAQAANYRSLIDGLSSDIKASTDKRQPRVTKGTGVYIGYDNEPMRETMGPPRIVINEGPPEYVQEDAPEDMPYIDLDYEDRLIESSYYEIYKWKRNFIYSDLIGNAAKRNDFTDFMDFSIEYKDSHFAGRLHLDLTADTINSPAYDMIAGPHELFEMARDKFNRNVLLVRESFEEFVSNASEGEFDVDEIEWRHSTLRSIIHAIKVRKIEKFIGEKFLTPLLEASQRKAIEYVALEEAKQLAVRS